MDSHDAKIRALVVKELTMTMGDCERVAIRLDVPVSKVRAILTELVQANPEDSDDCGCLGSKVRRVRGRYYCARCGDEIKPAPEGV